MRPRREAPFVAEDNVIAGNVICYGATSGEIFVRGTVGERFCVRNSGATAVVEGVGDHALEYMTGGRVVILGPVGRNIAAGMSGGIGYALDLEVGRVNPDIVDLDPLEDADRAFLLGVVRLHEEETGSAVAARLLADWDASVARHQDHAPRLQGVLAASAAAERDGRDVNVAIMEASRG